MKLSAKKIKECAQWVEQNGLYPQRCGASIKLFCEAMGINPRTYNNWSSISEFAEAIAHAREVFQQNTVREVTNALVKAAKGVDFTKTKQKGRAQVVKEYDPKTGKKIKEYTTEKIVTVESYRETVYFPPDVNAAKFLLTNMDPDNWKNKQDNTADLNLSLDEAPVIVFSDSPSQEAEDSPASETEPDLM